MAPIRFVTDEDFHGYLTEALPRLASIRSGLRERASPAGTSRGSSSDHSVWVAAEELFLVLTRMAHWEQLHLEYRGGPPVGEGTRSPALETQQFPNVEPPGLNVESYVEPLLGRRSGVVADRPPKNTLLSQVRGHILTHPNLSYQ